jgi:hypothetical protein
MARKPQQNEKPQVNEELSGFEVKINEFGEILSNYDVSKLNDFLDRKVTDKKFRGIDVERRVDDPAKDAPKVIRDAREED